MGSTLPDQNVVPPSLVEAWRADISTPAELQRGYARFLRQPRRPRPRLQVAGWVLGGLVLGMSLAQAATLVRGRLLRTQEVEITARPRPTQPVTRAAGTVAVSVTPSAAAPVASVVEPSQGRAPSLEVAPPVPAVEAELAELAEAEAPQVREPHVQRQWQRAAAEMRSRNLREAEAAFVEIEERAVGSERDAARLARAQLLAQSGRAAEALTLARELQARTRSSIVSRKARDLTLRLEKNVEADRSTRPDAEAKEP